MATFKFYLKRPNDVKETNIFCRISYSPFILKYYTKEVIKPSKWLTKDKKGNSISGKASPTAEEINKNLNEFVLIANSILNDYKFKNEQELPVPNKLKLLIDAKYKNDNSTLLRPNFESYFTTYTAELANGVRKIGLEGRQMSERRIKDYNHTLTLISEFKVAYRQLIKDNKDFKNVETYKYVPDTPLEFEQMNNDFYNYFVYFLQHYKHHSPNNIGKIIKIIKAVLRQANIDKLTELQPFLNSKAPTEKTHSIALNANQLQEITDLNLTGKLEIVRDLFIIGCHTGLRLSDVKQLNAESMNGGKLSVITKKTNQKLHLPISNEVKRIYKKYDGNFKIYSDAHFNKALATICEQIESLQNTVEISSNVAGVIKKQRVKLCTMVHSHTMRRTFATMAFNDDVPTLTIMSITGHTTESSFIKYIKLSNEEHVKKFESHKEKAKGNKSNLKAVL
jgi:integrase